MARTGRPSSASLHLLGEELRRAPNHKLPSPLNLVRLVAKPLVVRPEPVTSKPDGVGDMDCIGALDAQ
jgi:hypothetical protein